MSAQEQNGEIVKTIQKVGVFILLFLTVCMEMALLITLLVLLKFGLDFTLDLICIMVFVGIAGVICTSSLKQLGLPTVIFSIGSQLQVFFSLNSFIVMLRQVLIFLLIFDLSAYCFFVFMMKECLNMKSVKKAKSVKKDKDTLLLLCDMGKWHICIVIFFLRGIYNLPTQPSLLLIE